MNALSRWLACFGLLLVSSVSLGAKDAQVIFQCYSIRLLPGTVKLLGQTHRLEATTAQDGTTNDEVGISDSDEFTYFYSTTLIYTDPTTFEQIPIGAYLDLPNPDLNRNGASDFLEVDVAVNNATSEGEVVLDDGVDFYYGTLNLKFNRAAGSATGTCDLRLRLPDFGLDLTFKHSFEIFDYRGTLSYHVQGTNVVAGVNLTRAGVAGSLQGPFLLTRVDQDELAYAATAWTNELNQAIQWYSSTDYEIPLYRGGLRTNYYTVLVTDDGMPGTDTTAEYMIWFITLFDANDSDHDGIADISDTPEPPKPPTLALRRDGQVLKLEITAELGLSVVVEQSPTLLPAAWSELQTITQTNATQEIEVPLPADRTAYWRAWVK